MNSTVKKKVNFKNSIQNEGLSPSCIVLSFDRFGSISWHSIWVLLALSHFIFSGFPSFRPEHHWRDLISRNAHLVHQNWYRISFTSNNGDLLYYFFDDDAITRELCLLTGYSMQVEILEIWSHSVCLFYNLYNSTRLSPHKIEWNNLNALH
jgi:hypothetical protein